MVNSLSHNPLTTDKHPRTKQTSDYDDTVIVHLSKLITTGFNSILGGW